MNNEEVTLRQVERMLRDLETRLETIQAVNQSQVNATDPDTPEGRKARLIQKAIRRFWDELAP